MVQWLGLSTSTAGTQVQSLVVRELRFCKPRGTAKKRKGLGVAALRIVWKQGPGEMWEGGLGDDCESPGERWRFLGEDGEQFR